MSLALRYRVYFIENFIKDKCLECVEVSCEYLIKDKCLECVEVSCKYYSIFIPPHTHTHNTTQQHNSGTKGRQAGISTEGQITIAYSRCGNRGA